MNIMKDSDDLDKLLADLKKDVPSKDASRWKGVRPDMHAVRSVMPGAVREQSDGVNQESGHNLIWSENKEAILMGMIVSACVVTVGALSGNAYITIIGGAAFGLLALIMAWVLVEYCRCFGKKNTR